MATRDPETRLAIEIADLPLKQLEQGIRLARKIIQAGQHALDCMEREWRGRMEDRMEDHDG